MQAPRTLTSPGQPAPGQRVERPGKTVRPRDARTQRALPGVEIARRSAGTHPGEVAPCGIPAEHAGEAVHIESRHALEARNRAVLEILPPPRDVGLGHAGGHVQVAATLYGPIDDRTFGAASEERDADV